MSKGSKSNAKAGTNEPMVENRKARHEYHILDTLECGMKLVGTEVKSVRAGQISLSEGFVRASESPPRLTLHGVHIAEYSPAGESFQHEPARTRTLLAQKREILKLADKTREAGVTLIPLKVYFVRGMAKMLIGLAKGKGKADKRQDIAKREAKRDIDRALSRRR